MIKLHSHRLPPSLIIQWLCFVRTLRREKRRKTQQAKIQQDLLAAWDLFAPLPKMQSKAPIVLPTRVQVKLHRVVMNEAHFLSNAVTAIIGYATRIQADRRRFVTVTPCPRIWNSKWPFWEFKTTVLLEVLGGAFSNANKTNNSIGAFVDMFAKYVTRHEKSQMVDGRQAVELPSKVYKVVFLNMGEKSRYQTNIQNLELDTDSKFWATRCIPIQPPTRSDTSFIIRQVAVVVFIKIFVDGFDQNLCSLQ